METRSKKKKAGCKTRELLRIGIATDFGWFELKAKLTAALNAAGCEIADIGAYELVTGECYPDFVVPLTKAPPGDMEPWLPTTSERGVEACSAINKIPGVFAVLYTERYMSKKVEEDEDLYVRCLGGQVTGYALSDKKTMNFLNPGYSSGIPSNHRLAKVKALKRENKTRTNEKCFV
jgi:ribose 5-phosphate isomerase RpiB